MFSRPLPWFSFKDRIRRKWRVVLSTPTITSDIDDLAGGCSGFTDFNRKLIVLDVRRPWAMIIETLFHEMGHAAADERDQMDRELEETAVRLISTPLLGIVRRAPFNMQVPEQPPEYGKFRRWSKLVDPLD